MTAKKKQFLTMAPVLEIKGVSGSSLMGGILSCP